MLINKPTVIQVVNNRAQNYDLVSSYRAYAHNLLCSKYVNPLQKDTSKKMN